VEAAERGDDVVRAASSSEAAMRRPFSRTSIAASARAPPPSAVLRLPAVPEPWGAPSVSP
jgi:hypothetical protein